MKAVGDRVRMRRARGLSGVGVAAVVAILAGLLVSAGAAPAQAAPPDIIRDSPVGGVSTLAVSAGVTYAGGSFTSVGAATGPGSVVDTATGAVNRKFAAVDKVNDGQVYAVAPDGLGGFYLGGSFLRVNGVPRTRLAHVLADGTLDPVWKPTVNAIVRALAVSGSSVYLVGDFAGVNSINDTVTRNYAAAVDATTGVATAWDPNLSSSVNTLAVSGSTVYLGGVFTTLNSPAVTRNRAAAVDATTGTATAWDPNLNSSVAALAVSGSTVYLGGAFTTVNSPAVTRNRAAAVDATTGTATAWDPNLNSAVFSLAVSGSTVYLGGLFTTLNSPAVTRSRAAAVDATTGTATAWDPNPNSFVRALAVSGAEVYVGGAQSHVNQVTRSRAAAFGPDGRVTAWNPNVGNGSVMSLAVSGSTVYLGGSFAGANSINGTLARNRAAAVDATAGTATAWDPNVDDSVRALAVSGSTVYLGGDFATINTTPALTRNGAAAADATTGTASAWDPNVSGGLVFALAVSGSTVYLGGSFTTINTPAVTRNKAAAVDTATGTATAWDPNMGATVLTMAVSGSTVYLGGDFTTINTPAVTRNRAAAVDTTNGTATTWDPNLNSSVAALAVSGSTVYLGGAFTTINTPAVSRTRAAAVDTTTGTATTWSPNASSTVTSLAVSGSAVSLGGAFNSVSANATQQGTSVLASLTLPGANPSQVVNPSVTGALLTWTPPVFGGIGSYYVMYRPLGSTQPWAIYAAGANNTGVSWTNPGSRNTCSATNTAMGWTSCPMVRGWNPAATYEFAIYPKTTEGKTKAGALTPQISYPAP